MNNFKKIGLSALAGSLVAFSANAGTLSASGSASLSFSNGDTKSLTDEGNQWTMGDSITMTGSGEMDNGMTISVSFEIDNDDVGGGNVYDSHSMTLDTNGMGTITFAGHGGSSAMSALDDVTPNAYEESWDIVTGADTGTRVSGASGDNMFTYTSPSISGVTVTAAYLNASSAVSDVSYSDIAIAYSPGVAIPCQEIEDNKDNTYKYTNKGNLVALIKGNAKNILIAERVALNFLSHISGIATKTNEFVKLAGKKTKICCTRKTIPNLRVIQKYAVKLGGGTNHRFNLSDEYLIKDNHIASSDLKSLVLKAIKNRKGKKITVEVDTIKQLRSILGLKFNRVLLDNMSIKNLRESVKIAKKYYETEASGNINLKTVKSVAATGVNRISVGSITHSAPAIDFKLEI